MSPEKRAELEKKLKAHGLTVLLTRDYDAILMQLARLAQFERLMTDAVKLYPSLDGVLEYVHAQQVAPPNLPDNSGLRPLEVIDVPTIMKTSHTGLQSILDRGGLIRPGNLGAATSAFIALLGATPQPEVKR